MTRSRFLATVLAAACAAGAPAAPDDATHDALRALRDGLLKAIADKDADAIVGYLHPDIALTTQDGWELQVIRKHAGVRDYLARTLTGPTPAVRSFRPALAVDELSILHGGDTAVSFGTSNDHYVLAGGREYDLPIRWSATLVKLDGQWKVASLQTSANPYDNPVLATVNRTVYWAAGIAGGVGLILGAVTARVFAGRKRPG